MEVNLESLNTAWKDTYTHADQARTDGVSALDEAITTLEAAKKSGEEISDGNQKPLSRRDVNKRITSLKKVRAQLKSSKTAGSIERTNSVMLQARNELAAVHSYTGLKENNVEGQLEVVLGDVQVLQDDLSQVQRTIDGLKSQIDSGPAAAKTDRKVRKLTKRLERQLKADSPPANISQLEKASKTLEELVPRYEMKAEKAAKAPNSSKVTSIHTKLESKKQEVKGHAEVIHGEIETLGTDSGDIETQTEAERQLDAKQGDLKSLRGFRDEIKSGDKKRIVQGLTGYQEYLETKASDLKKSADTLKQARIKLLPDDVQAKSRKLDQSKNQIKNFSPEVIAYAELLVRVENGESPEEILADVGEEKAAEMLSLLNFASLDNLQGMFAFQDAMGLQKPPIIAKPLKGNVGVQVGQALGHQKVISENQSAVDQAIADLQGTPEGEKWNASLKEEASLVAEASSYQASADKVEELVKNPKKIGFRSLLAVRSSIQKRINTGKKAEKALKKDVKEAQSALEDDRAKGTLRNELEAVELWSKEKTELPQTDGEVKRWESEAKEEIERADGVLHYLRKRKLIK